MSVRVMSQVWEYANVSGGKLLVLLVLADFADDTGTCWPSIRAVAAKARMSERGTTRVIKALEAAGYVAIVEVGGGRVRTRYLVRPRGR